MKKEQIIAPGKEHSKSLLDYIYLIAGGIALVVGLMMLAEIAIGLFLLFVGYTLVMWVLGK